MARRPMPTHRLRRLGALLLSAGLVTGLVATVGVASVAAVSGATITVNDFTDPIGNSDTGECTLREAITSALTDTASGATPGECVAGQPGVGDLVVFAGTTPQAITLNAEFAIGTDVTVDGGNLVTLSGNDSFRVFNVTGGTLGLRDLAIQDGFSSGQGGAIFTDTGTHLVLDHVTISGSNAFQGGAIGSQGALTMRDTTISGNTTSSVGGGIFVNDDATIERSTFSSNTSGLFAGALETEGGTISIVGSTFSGNSATGGSSGAIYSEGGPMSIDTSTFTGNTATSDGGAIHMGNSTLAITRSTLDHNTAGGNGGAISSTVPLTVTNSTIANNTATGRGGAIFRTAALTLTHSTISLNSAADALGGDGIDSAGALDTVATAIRNTVIAGNGADWANWGGSIATPGVTTNSKIGLGANTLSQLLDPAGLQSNGGPTRTIKPVASSTNPLLGAANGTICTAAPASATDQRGYGRATPCDIGAVELDRTKPVLSNAKLTVREGSLLSGTSSRVRLTWTTTEKESGVKSFRILRSVNGGSFTTYVASQTTPYLNLTLSNGTRYAYKVRAVDREGNVGAYIASPTVTPRLVQQSSSSVAFKGTWSTKTLSAYSGGSARYSSTKGASVTITATGRAYAFVTTTGPGRGRANVFVNGSFLETIDLYSASTTYLVQAWSKTYSSSQSRTIRIVVLATSLRPRIDADAFVVLQ